MKKLVFISMALVAFTITGCAGTTAQVTAKTLLATQQEIVAVHEAFRTPCKNGTVPASTCTRVDAITNEAKPAYDAAVDAAILSLQTGNAADATEKQAALNQLAVDLLTLATKYSVEVAK